MQKVKNGQQYKNYTYNSFTLLEDDNQKIMHEIIDSNGSAFEFDWSPYATPSVEEFQLFIDLGCPKRIGIGPLNGDQLLTIKNGGK